MPDANQLWCVGLGWLPAARPAAHSLPPPQQAGAEKMKKLMG